MAFITGHLSASFNDGATTGSIGTTEQGWELRENHLVEDIITDEGGDAPVDGVQRGTRVELHATYVEYDLMKRALYQANPRGTTFTNVGKLYTALAGRLILTPTVGTPAATDLGAGNSLVFYKAVVQTDISTLLATKLRKGPLTFRCYPDSGNSNKVYDIVATPAS